MLQTALGGPLMAIRGFTHQEVSQTYTRARELCEILGDNPQLFPALWGLWAFYYSTANIRAAFEVTQQMLRPADKDPRVDKLMLAHHITGVTLLHMGEPSSARTHFEHALEISDPKYDRDIIDSIQQSSITTVLSYNAWAVWQLGYPDRARELAKEAVLVAENLAHPPSLAATLLYSSIFHQFLGEADTVGEEAEASLALCCEYGFPLFLYNSTILKAWSDARLGRKERIADIRDCLERLRAIGTELGRPYLDSLLAECLLLKGDLTAGLQVVDEGLGLSDRTGDLLNYTELYRLKGDLLVEFAEGRGSPLHPGRPLSQPGKETVLVNAETCFLKAVLSLARLWARRGKDRDALKILKGVYEWFTEGLGTPLLIEAKGVLESLSHGPLE
jgi:adenylate cyclase